MKRVQIACFIFAAMLGTLGLMQPGVAQARRHPTAIPSASPVPSEVPGVRDVVVDQFVAWQVGALDRAKYDAVFNTQIGDAQVKKVSLELDHLGAFQSAEYLGPATVRGGPPGAKSYVYRMICADGAVYERISIDAIGKVAGILFADLPSGLTGE